MFRAVLTKLWRNINVRYDGTVRNFANQIVKFLCGAGGMDATFLDDQGLCTIRLTDEKLRDEFYLHLADPKFGCDSRRRQHLSSEICSSARQDAQLHLMLNANFIQIVSD